MGEQLHVRREREPWLVPVVLRPDDIVEMVTVAEPRAEEQPVRRVGHDHVGFDRVALVQVADAAGSPACSAGARASRPWPPSLSFAVIGILAGALVVDHPAVAARGRVRMRMWRKTALAPRKARLTPAGPGPPARRCASPSTSTRRGRVRSAPGGSAAARDARSTSTSVVYVTSRPSSSASATSGYSLPRKSPEPSPICTGGRSETTGRGGSRRRGRCGPRRGRSRPRGCRPATSSRCSGSPGRRGCRRGSSGHVAAAVAVADQLEQVVTRAATSSSVGTWSDGFHVASTMFVPARDRGAFWCSPGKSPERHTSRAPSPL